MKVRREREKARKDANGQTFITIAFQVHLILSLGVRYGRKIKLLLIFTACAVVVSLTVNLSNLFRCSES